MEKPKIDEKDLCTCCKKKPKAVGNHFLCNMCYRYHSETAEEQEYRVYADLINPCT